MDVHFFLPKYFIMQHTGNKKEKNKKIFNIFNL